MKLFSIVGARPQFIKAASVSRAIQKYNSQNPYTRIKEIIVHTGQHYDGNMSQVFFDELEIPEPTYNLGVGSGSHGKMTGAMLERIEEIIFQEYPDIVLVYGDTNSTLAGALAAAKLHLPVGHVEAGLRSFNRLMPEEVNRVLTDHVSDLLFCPSDVAVINLRREGITKGVSMVGDVMFDSFLFYKEIAAKKSKILSDLTLEPKGYCLATVHREENTTDHKKLSGIFDAFKRLASQDCPFIVPLHPRTARCLKEMGIGQSCDSTVRFLEPLPYLDMIRLETSAKAILTDSGGVQKEAYFAQVPCVTLREETEWTELVKRGFNRVAGCEARTICAVFREMICRTFAALPDLYGGGKASERIIRILGSAIK